MRTLLHCSSYIRNAQDRDLLVAWLNLAWKLNGDSVDILVVDSASPWDFRPYMPEPMQFKMARILDDDHVPILPGGNMVLRFKDAIGHPYHDNLKFRAGPCRAWMRAMECAIASGYDHIVYIESDILCVKPVEWIAAAHTHPVMTGGPIANHDFDEVGIFSASVDWLWKNDFIAQYNWKGPVTPIGEKRMMAILDRTSSRGILPMLGNRDQFVTTPATYNQHYPDGLDFLTHAIPPTLQYFLQTHEHGECWPAGGLADPPQPKLITDSVIHAANMNPEFTAGIVGGAAVLN